GGRGLAMHNAADYGVAPPPQLEIDKKIVELNNVAVSGAPTDTVEAAGTDAATPRLAVNNAGTGDAGHNNEGDDNVAWHMLPEGVVCADISDLPAWATCLDDGLAAGYPGQNVIVFELPAALAAESTVFFDYDLTIREDTSVSTELTNTASIASFTA